MARHKLWVLVFLLPIFCVAQTISGRVIDKETREPIETVAVYFDNTTLGTTTNEKGKFSITYSDAIQSTLVISYLGYEKVFISNYREKSNILVELVEAENTLDEVFIAYDDGLTRKQKLKLFRKEFLGSSNFARSCKILNEEDLILRYNKKFQSLSASSKAPIKVNNRALGYQITFEIMDFEVIYKYVSYRNNSFTTHSVTYMGTSLYQSLEKPVKKRSLKNRDKAYKGSVQHFMRSLFNKSLEKEGYHIFYDKFRVNEWKYFSVKPIEDQTFKKVTLSNKVSILFDKKNQSELQLEIPEFYVDVYGNYTPIIGVYFSGAMGKQRIGDSLPSDYGLNEKAQD